MKTHLTGTSLTFKTDVRDLLTTPEIRELVLAHLAPRLSCGLARGANGLSVMVRDDATGSIVGVTPLRGIVTTALLEGSLTHNAADRLDGAAALDIVVVELSGLLDLVKAHQATVGEPEEGFEMMTLKRSPLVEKELEAELARVG